MKDYEAYFINILSRSWLGSKREKTINSIEKTNIIELYLSTFSDDCIILLGKTEKFYFILECFDSEGYKYSNGLFNENIIELIKCYKKKNLITGGKNEEDFVKSIFLKTKLDKELSEKQIRKQTFKI